MKRSYDVCLQEGTKDNPITFEFDTLNTYREAVAKAKRMSLQIGSKVGGHDLVAVCICCYFSNEVSDYNIAWYEDYADGKKVTRFGEL